MITGTKEKTYDPDILTSRSQLGNCTKVGDVEGAARARQKASWSDGGYFASRRDWHRLDPGPRYLYGATVWELLARIEQAPAVQRGLSEYRPLQLPEG